MRSKIDGLRSLYAGDGPVKWLMDVFAARQRNANETKVDRLFALLQKEEYEDCTRSTLVKALKKLEELGFCEYVIGRHGHPSRVRWKVGIVSLGEAAAGKRDTLDLWDEGEMEDDISLSEPLVTEIADEVSASPSNGTMRVGYPLRPDLNIQLALPKNLTRREAERLSDFIRTLPFEETRVTELPAQKSLT